MANASSTRDTTLTCGRCGGVTDAGDAFCGECGSPLASGASASARVPRGDAAAPAPRRATLAKDARPTIARNDTNLWSRSERIRDQLYDLVAAACAERG